LRSTSTHHSAGLFPSRNSIHNFSFLPHHLPWCAHKPNSRTLCFAFLGFIPYSNTLRVYPAPIMVGPDPSKVIDKVLMSSWGPQYLPGELTKMSHAIWAHYPHYMWIIHQWRGPLDSASWKLRAYPDSPYKMQCIHEL
jgi:hypothetical protein